MAAPRFAPGALAIPRDRDGALLRFDGREVGLSNLRKPFWPELGITKGDLLQYYADVAPLLVPYLKDRAEVMKRYPNGAGGEYFYMKRTPAGAPPWLRTCAVEHGSGSVIAFPVIEEVAGLLWLVNLGCIDLNEWYARCDDIDRPDYLHFDLDPVEGTPFATVRTVALHVRDALSALGIPAYPKTSGSSGMHIYVPIVRGPLQKDVWTFAKAFAQTLERMHPETVTAEYRIARRPVGRVLVDYNQNAWGKTLASVYSVRPTPVASISTPVTWDEVAAGIEIADFTLATIRARLERVGDLWEPVGAPGGRVDLARFLTEPAKPRAKRKAPAP